MNGAGDIDHVVQTVTTMLPSGVEVKVEAVAGRNSSDRMVSAGLKDLGTSKQ